MAPQRRRGMEGEETTHEGWSGGCACLCACGTRRACREGSASPGCLPVRMWVDCCEERRRTVRPVIERSRGRKSSLGFFRLELDDDEWPSPSPFLSPRPSSFYVQKEGEQGNGFFLACFPSPPFLLTERALFEKNTRLGTNPAGGEGGRGRPRKKEKGKGEESCSRRTKAVMDVVTSGERERGEERKVDISRY